MVVYVCTAMSGYIRMDARLYKRMYVCRFVWMHLCRLYLAMYGCVWLCMYCYAGVPVYDNPIPNRRTFQSNLRRANCHSLAGETG